MATLEGFFTKYEDARAHFLEVIDRLEKNAACDRSTFKVPSKFDPELYVDDVYFPPTGTKKKTLLIVTSGVHGMEAATGSAIQTKFFESIFPGLDRSSLGIYGLHCFNPYGFKYQRRNTENNVNLNRNFGFDADHYKTPNDGYRKLAKWVERPSSASRPLIPLAKSILFLLKALTLGRFSKQELNQTLAQGQFEYPKGLEFGGFNREPQVEFFVSRVSPLIKDYDQVILFDLHTGLGERGDLYLIAGDDPRCIDQPFYEKLFPTAKFKDLFTFIRGDEPGFYKTVGDLNSLVAKLSPDPRKVLALTFEFGTLGNSGLAKIRTLERILIENTGFHNGYRTASDEAWARIQFRELFEPSDEKWRERVMKTGLETMKRALANLDA